MKGKRKSPEQSETDTFPMGKAIPPEAGMQDLKLGKKGRRKIFAIFPSFHPGKWVIGVGMMVLFLYVGGVVFSVYQAMNEPPQILALTPNPLKNKTIPPDITGAALFSQPMDEESVEGGLFYYIVQPDGEQKGPFPIRGKGEFHWKDGSREVSFHLLPEFYPHPGEVYILEVRGLKAKNGKLLRPEIMKARFTIGFRSPFPKSTPAPKDWKEMRKLYREWIESGGEMP